MDLSSGLADGEIVRCCFGGVTFWDMDDQGKSSWHC